MKLMGDAPRPADDVPASLIPAARWREFREWVAEGGYDESYFNRWDSKSRQLEEAFLEETAQSA